MTKLDWSKARQRKLDPARVLEVEALDLCVRDSKNVVVRDIRKKGGPARRAKLAEAANRRAVKKAADRRLYLKKLGKEFAEAIRRRLELRKAGLLRFRQERPNLKNRKKPKRGKS